MRTEASAHRDGLYDFGQDGNPHAKVDGVHGVEQEANLKVCRTRLVEQGDHGSLLFLTITIHFGGGAEKQKHVARMDALSRAEE